MTNNVKIGVKPETKKQTTFSDYQINAQKRKKQCLENRLIKIKKALLK